MDISTSLHHHYYSHLKGLSAEEEATIINFRKDEYQHFGIMAAALTLVLGFNVMLLLTNSVGAALVAADLEKSMQLRRFTILPYDPKYRLWQNALLPLVLYSAWAAPFEFGFLPVQKFPLNVVDYVVDLFFAIDTAITFFVAYLDRRTYDLVDNQHLIMVRAIRYGVRSSKSPSSQPTRSNSSTHATQVQDGEFTSGTSGH